MAEGERRLEPLPVERLVGHFRHSQQATTFIGDTLKELGVTLLPVYFEDLYTGERESRLAHLKTLFDFLEFTPADLETHRDLIEDKIFNSGQNTPSVAPHVPNLKEVLEALQAAGCNIEESILKSADILPPAAVEPPSGPRERIARECAAFARTYETRGPYLEISNDAPHHAVLLHEQFAGETRHFIGPKEGADAGDVSTEVGDPNDMRALYADGQFGTVLWTSALAHDKRFWLTLEEIRRVLAPGGTLVVVAPGFSKGSAQAGITITGQKGNAISNATITHRVQASPDYWRVSPQAVREVILDGFDVLDVKAIMVPPRIFGVAVKPA